MNTQTANLPQTPKQVWADWDRTHGEWRQYDYWKDPNSSRVEVRRVTRPIGGGHTFVRAEVGDLVLVRWETPTMTHLMPHKDKVYCPRVGWVVSASGSFHTEALIPEGENNEY